MNEKPGEERIADKAMVLAAGFGKRLRPLTELVPKPLLPICNRPVVEYILRFLRRNGVRRTVINLHHKGRTVMDRLSDGDKFDVEINYSCEEVLLGTAGGIKAAERYFLGAPFFVINSDILVSLDLDAVRRFHRDRGAAATLVLREEEASAYGVIKVDAEGRVVQFLSTAARYGGSPVVEAMFTGVQLLEPSLLKRIPPGVPWGTSENLYPVLLEEGVPVYGYIMKGAWIDVGTPKRYLHANFMALRDPSLLELTEPGGGVVIESDVEMGGGAELRAPILLGEGCSLGKGSVIGPNVVMGSRCRVGSACRINNSVIWDNVQAGGGSIIEGSIVAAGLTLSPASVIKGKIVTGDGEGPLTISAIGD